MTDMHSPDYVQPHDHITRAVLRRFDRLNDHSAITSDPSDKI